MSRRIAIVALLPIGLACSDSSSSASTTADDPVGTVSGSQSTTAGAASDGVAFVDPDGRFSIVFPSEPTSQPGRAPVPGTEGVVFVNWLAGTKDLAFATTCIDYGSAGDLDIDLDLAVAGAVANVRGTLDSSTDIELQGRSGVEFTGSVASGGVEGGVTGRMFLDGETICQAIVIGLDTDDEAIGFLDSFQFLEPAA